MLTRMGCFPVRRSSASRTPGVPVDQVAGMLKLDKGWFRESNPVGSVMHKVCLRFSEGEPFTQYYKRSFTGVQILENLSFFGEKEFQGRHHTGRLGWGFDL